MTLGERILLLIAKSPDGDDYCPEEPEWTLENALSLFVQEYSDFESLVTGKHVADFGCGYGYQSIALAMRYDCSGVGIDTNRRSLETAMNLAATNNVLETQLFFVDRITDEMKGRFDVVISQNSFEHFNDPVAILNEMKELLTESGKLLITFGAPWWAPYGSHMLFTDVPWINLLFSERTVMKVRSRFRHDGAERYEDVESGLNKMTIAGFERLVSSSGMTTEFRRYRCVKGMTLLGKIPILRELFINHVSVVLANAPQ